MAEAKYYGRCIACPQKIEPGDPIVATADGAMHVECSPEDFPPEPDTPPKVCPICYLTICEHTAPGG